MGLEPCMPVVVVVVVVVVGVVVVAGIAAVVVVVPHTLKQQYNPENRHSLRSKKTRLQHLTVQTQRIRTPISTLELGV